MKKPRRKFATPDPDGDRKALEESQKKFFELNDDDDLNIFEEAVRRLGKIIRDIKGSHNEKH